MTIDYVGNALKKARVSEDQGAEYKRQTESPPVSPSSIQAISDILDSIYTFAGRFIAYPSEHDHAAHSLWCAHTHLMDSWESTPRLAFLSAEPKSGKTRALEITELLVPFPVETVNVSPAYIFHKVKEGATILHDE